VNRYVEELLTAVNDSWVAAAEDMSEGDWRKHWSPSTTSKRKHPVPLRAGAAGVGVEAVSEAGGEQGDEEVCGGPS